MAVGSERHGALVERVWALAEPIAREEGLELVDVEFQREARGWVLRVLLERGTGVTLDDCRRVSEQLGDVLDVEDLIEHPYALEVSSPGLDRPLVSEADFVRFAGRRVRVVTREPVEGQRRFRGRLRGLEGAAVVLEREDGVRVAIPRAAIARARLEVEL